MSKKQSTRLILSPHSVAVPFGLMGLKEVHKEIKKGARYYVVEGNEDFVSRLHAGINKKTTKYPVFEKLSFGHAKEEGLELIPAEGKGKYQKLSFNAETGDPIAKRDLLKALKKNGVPADHILAYFGWDAIKLASRNIDMVETLTKHYSRPEAAEKTTGHIGSGHKIVLDVLKQKTNKKIPHRVLEAVSFPWLELSNKITLAYFLPEKHLLTKEQVEDMAVTHFLLGEKSRRKYVNHRKKDDALSLMHEKMLGLLADRMKIKNEIHKLEFISPPKRLKRSRNQLYSKMSSLKQKKKENYLRIRKQKSEIKKRLKTVKY